MAGARRTQPSHIPSPYLGAPYGFLQDCRWLHRHLHEPAQQTGAIASGWQGYEGRSESQVIEAATKFGGILPRVSQQTTKEWLELLFKEDIWCAQVNDFAEVEKDPQVAENEMIVSWEQPDVGTVRSVGNPGEVSARRPGRINRPAPAIGEHTPRSCVNSADTRRRR